jgi:hypothetical protein
MSANARQSKIGEKTPTPISEYLASIGSKGGKISRRTLTTAQAKAMVKARESKRPKKPKRVARRSNVELSEPGGPARPNSRQT